MIMAQQIQQLIDRIKEEGVQAAEQKAAQVEKESQQKAHQIIEDARNEAEKMIADAREDIEKLQQASHMALQQSARDMLLTLQIQLQAVLQGIVAKEVQDTLNAENMMKVVQSLVERDSGSAQGGIELTLSEADAKVLKDSFLSKLQKAIKQEIVIQSADDIHKGFTISFDQGRSSFDFSDESLAEYLGAFLNHQLALIIKETTQK
jgi:V/A-type H+-transporting ATPase subunit E